jgi:hypothetical protein
MMMNKQRIQKNEDGRDQGKPEWLYPPKKVPQPYWRGRMIPAPVWTM